MAIDIDQSHYSTGTATVSGVNVTGFGTTFTVLRKGDQWGTHKGFGVRIAGITDDTHLTLAYEVPGLQQTAAPFEVQRTPYDIGYLQAIEDIIRLMGEGALPSLAGVDGLGGDKLIKLIGPKTAVAFDGKRVINIAALTGAGVIEFDALGNAVLVPKADLITGVDTDGKANTITERNEKFGAQATGFSVLVANIGDGRSAIYFKNTTALNDWSVAAPLTGATGQAGPFTEITFGPVTTVSATTPASANVVVVDADTIRIDLSIPKGQDGSGTGDFVGPAGGVADGDLVAFADATGKRGKKAGLVSNSQLATVPTATFKGRNASGVGAPGDLTPSEALALLKSAGAYAKDNIIGTVSQVAGVPTGPIIERGSNANGSYVRWADGTQICWGRISVSLIVTEPYFGGFRSNGQIVTYPAAFSAIASVLAGNSGDPGSFGANAVNTGGNTGTFINFTTVTIDSGVRLRVAEWIAIGRWF